MISANEYLRLFYLMGLGIFIVLLLVSLPTIIHDFKQQKKKSAKH